jgi:hypothetical protein
MSDPACFPVVRLPHTFQISGPSRNFLSSVSVSDPHIDLDTIGLIGYFSIHTVNETYDETDCTFTRIYFCFYY